MPGGERERSGMTVMTIGPEELTEVMALFRDLLQEHQGTINRLNVFPVPDGDTGTNMLLTLESVCSELEEVADEAAGDGCGLRGDRQGLADGGSWKLRRDPLSGAPGLDGRLPRRLGRSDGVRQGYGERQRGREERRLASGGGDDPHGREGSSDGRDERCRFRRGSRRGASGDERDGDGGARLDPEAPRRS